MILSYYSLKILFCYSEVTPRLIMFSVLATSSISQLTFHISLSRARLLNWTNKDRLRSQTDLHRCSHFHFSHHYLYSPLHQCHRPHSYHIHLLFFHHLQYHVMTLSNYFFIEVSMKAAFLSRSTYLKLQPLHNHLHLDPKRIQYTDFRLRFILHTIINL